MIGNVIQSRYLEVTDYPTAAALSFLLMALILIMVLAWARFAGTESLMGAEALMEARHRRRRAPGAAGSSGARRWPASAAG